MKYAAYVRRADGQVTGTWAGAKALPAAPDGADYDVVEVSAEEFGSLQQALTLPGSGLPGWRVQGGRLEAVQDPRPVIRFAPAEVDTTVEAGAYVTVKAELVGTGGKRAAESRAVELDVPWGDRTVPLALLFKDGVATLEISRARPISTVIQTSDRVRIEAPLRIRIRGTRLE